ncbi:MAG TPA: hypothetical protein VHO03_02735 [Ignavibacteriales bacterium]|nr:hypothetical protein [Ignavibacteriales bacterium]
MRKIFLFILLSLIVSSCRKENPAESSNENSKENKSAAADTLRREVIKGVFLFADSLKDVYTLDENVYARVHLKNENNQEGLPVFIGNYPPFTNWFITDLDNNIVNQGPLTIGASEFNKTLYPGEELAENFKWSQNIYDKNTMTSGLKAFAGDYTLELGFRGVNCPPLIKHFTISEEGDPFSYNVSKDYNAKDTLKFDFVLRNRIFSSMTLNTSGQPWELFLIKTSSSQTPDTVFVQKFAFEKSVYNLGPKSDNIIFSFSRPEKDFINQGITGAFDMVLNFYFKEKTISSRTAVYIY